MVGKRQDGRELRDRAARDEQQNQQQGLRERTEGNENFSTTSTAPAEPKCGGKVRVRLRW